MIVVDVLRAVKIAAGLDSNFKVNKIIIRDSSACTVYDTDKYKALSQRIVDPAKS